MNRAPRDPALDSRASAFAPAQETRPAARATGLVAIMLATCFLASCASPTPVVTNVIRDSHVTGCLSDPVELIPRTDVMVVIDTSLSTRRPSGIDVDGDNRTPVFQRNSTIDRADSRLAAVVAKLRPLFQESAGQDVRFSIATFAGTSNARTVGTYSLAAPGSESKRYTLFTKNRRILEQALDQILERGSGGTSVFYAGMHRALRAFETSPTSGRRRVALLLSDGPRPTGIAISGVDHDGDVVARDPRLKSAALTAQKQRTVFHTFGLSSDAELWRHDALGQIAGATGGNYHPVEDASQLYCHLVSSLSAPSLESDWERAFARVKRQKADANQRNTE